MSWVGVAVFYNADHDQNNQNAGCCGSRLLGKYVSRAVIGEAEQEGQELWEKSLAVWMMMPMWLVGWLVEGWQPQIMSTQEKMV